MTNSINNNDIDQCLRHWVGNLANKQIDKGLLDESSRDQFLFDFLENLNEDIKERPELDCRIIIDAVSRKISGCSCSGKEAAEVANEIMSLLIRHPGGSDTSNELGKSVPVATSTTPLSSDTLKDTSIQEDYLVCLEDGQKLKMLKRHLRTQHDMSPEEYRRKWGLNPDYPMVAPSLKESALNRLKVFGVRKQKKRRDS